MSNITVEEALALTNQTLFNRICIRAKDKRKAVGATTCLYRDFANKTECFIGDSIPDSVYKPEWDDTEKPSGFVEILKIMPLVTIDFAESVQSIHDIEPPNIWNDLLKNLAERFELETPNLD